MSDAKLEDLSIAEAGAKLRDGSLTSATLTRHALDRIAKLDGALHAFVLVTEERALEDAARADAELAAGTDHGPMHGIPYALKDIYDTAGIRTTCHSKLLIDNVPGRDSVVAAKLASGGGVLLGKLATHEFAMGGPSFDLPFPPARNPWNTGHITGGSSSGSGAAVAAGMVRMAMGSDTGGSIRGPAAYCGTVGLKPTYGLISRRGVFPLSYTLDHCGPLTRSVEDAAITTELLAGFDPLDPASADKPKADLRSGLEDGVAGLRIGMPRNLYRDAEGLSPEVYDAIERVGQALEAAGAIVEEVTLPDYALFNACGRVILTAEAFAIHEKDLRERPEDYGELFLMRIVTGAAISSADYIQAQRLRRELSLAVNREALKTYDVLLTACALGPAPAFADCPPDRPVFWPIQSMPFNVTGNPALSMPAGLSASGLPLSAQLVGRPFDEATLLRVGRAVEKATASWGATAPALLAAE
ncbi:Amidase [Roseomonas mucosa]|uniref:Asp-tRNA(Asn)/Glu-tRNA(Gln) amidotransferase GatCAB subunit A n=1 Tax=Roseomonas TaxID=125216 RepID=UPI00095AA92D|nr:MULTISPECIES: Asp-tRNA(Asn)/Glu-tRNA(Gln) amidotransferase GatCAB subunit A [Roseomonas]MDT8262450.1 Asp-tRNA(Asn)/Glu-tRNA(Gln) amidotransferase GatCAB subunit A [Roseomonas sp. DSM 102946]ATR22134.1 Asp-tRNA(Asn)/Glu-tRNA(Gln) amidotransferase GatCAB subunit A [Roseomonas sp. FDAARGOS_362]USQ73281.1 Asp-tRNA(Asn)/Glu-tRNA(Gln) amidotransferase GatCAB subunit A [Roseomonas mucosa]UZO95358.1 Amidase [Roseomonas mucosa]GAV32572.1 glutamyl-tRNA(Gln) amidotransferase subunit A [Roseomonas sp. 